MVLVPFCKGVDGVPQALQGGVVTDPGVVHRLADVAGAECNGSEVEMGQCIEEELLSHQVECILNNVPIE